MSTKPRNPNYINLVDGDDEPLKYCMLCHAAYYESEVVPISSTPSEFCSTKCKEQDENMLREARKASEEAEQEWFSREDFFSSLEEY